VQLCTCRELLHELALVLHYQKLARVLARAELSPDHVLQWLATHAEIVVIAPLPEPFIAADPSDDLVLACALAAQASVILSGDHHLLAQRQYRDIAIRRAAEWLRCLPA
jgi:putative PIN family toxin of toxin-antitoxin system